MFTLLVGFIGFVAGAFVGKDKLVALVNWVKSFVSSLKK